MEYAVRGTVVIAADEINKELSEGKSDKKYNFDKILYTNIGNPQSVGQVPLTWPRQVLALVDLPEKAGVEHKLVRNLFPEDAIERAMEIKAGLGGHGSGAYSHSKGALCFRKDVAGFIQERDGYPSDPESIFLTNGASSGIVMIMTALMSDSSW
jgi:alanine transaminase